MLQLKNLHGTSIHEEICRNVYAHFALPAFYTVLSILAQIHILLKSKLMNGDHFFNLIFSGEKKIYIPPALPKISNSWGLVELKIKKGTSYSK